MFYPLTKPLSGVVKGPKESASIAVSLFRVAFYLLFSNALIIELKQRKSQPWRRFGFLVLISIDFDDFSSPFTPQFWFDWEDISMFDRLSKHLEFCKRFSAVRRIFNSLLGVWISLGNTVSPVWHFQPQHKSRCTKLSDGNDVDLQENERVRKKSFQYERLCTKTRFKTDEKVTWKWLIMLKWLSMIYQS